MILQCGFACQRINDMENIHVHTMFLKKKQAIPTHRQIRYNFEMIRDRDVPR